MLHTVEEAISPLLKLCFICGLDVFEYPIEGFKLFVSVLYITLFWTIFLSFAAFLLSVFKLTTIFYSQSFIFIISSNAVSSFMLVLINLYYNKKFQTVLKSLDILDDTLEELGCTKGYQKIRMEVYEFLAIWVVVVLSFDITDVCTTVLLYKQQHGPYVPLFANSYLHFNCLMNLKVWIVLRYIGSRFEQVNKCLENVLDDMQHEKIWLRQKLLQPSVCWNPTAQRKYQHQMWTALHVHRKLCELARELNELWQIYLTFEAGVDFVFFIGFFIFMYQILSLQRADVFQKFVLSISMDVCGAYYIAKVVYTNYIFETVSAKANSTQTIIQELRYVMNNDDMSKDLSQFALQILQKPLKFTAMGLFTFGYQNVISFFETVLTSVVVLTQLQAIPDTDLITYVNISVWEEHRN